MTAANSSSISDGAAALVLMRASEAKRRKLQPLAKIAGVAGVAQAPAWFTTAPVGAIKKLLEQVGWSAKDVDLYEINEAFAVVTMAAMRDLGLPHEKVNVHGGACALGHPIGASGARIIVTLLAAMEKYGQSKGVASLCIGGGEATAVAVERMRVSDFHTEIGSLRVLHSGQGRLVPLAALVADARRRDRRRMLAFTAWRRLARGLLWGAIVALLICGLSPLGDLPDPAAGTALFPRGPGPSRVAPIAGIIVLGGAEDSRAMDSPQLAALNEAAERYTEAVALARQLPRRGSCSPAGRAPCWRPSRRKRRRRAPVRGAGDSQGQDHAGIEVARHLRERDLHRAPAQSAARAALAARHLGLRTCRGPWAASAAQGSRWSLGRSTIARRAGSV